MRFLKIILSVFALFYRLTPNYLIISDVYFLRGKIDRLTILAKRFCKNGLIRSIPTLI